MQSSPMRNPRKKTGISPNPSAAGRFGHTTGKNKGPTLLSALC